MRIMKMYCQRTSIDSKMIRLTLCLLLSTAALAQHYAAPMDYNGDIYNRETRVSPTSNLIFNFEQLRKDQPPQVEMRDENLGKYMGRPRPTTHMPIIPHRRDYSTPEYDNVHLHFTETTTTMKPFVQQNWDPVSSHLPANMPPAPTTPKWMDLSDDSFRQHSHHQQSRHGVNTYQRAPMQEAAPARPVPSFPVQWNQPQHDETVQQPIDMSYSNPLTQYPTQQVDYSKPVEHYREPVQRSAPYRGSHKFQWEDVAQQEQTVTSSIAPPMVPHQNLGPPSSVPTLSPWIDGYGK